MNPVENYCRQYHTADVLSMGKCEMCGGTSVFPHFHREDEDVLTPEETMRNEVESHTHPVLP